MKSSALVLITCIQVIIGADRTSASTARGKDDLPPVAKWDLAYVDDKSSNLYLSKGDGSHKILLAKGGSFPCWSPDGSQIAYYKGKSVELKNLTTGKTRVILTSKDLVPGRLAFDHSFPILDIPFGDAIKLAGLAGKDHGIYEGQHRRGYVNATAWSPSGKKFIFTSDGDIWIGTRDQDLMQDLSQGYPMARGYVNARRLAPLAFFYEAPGGSMSTPYWVDDLAWFGSENSILFHYQRQGGSGVSKVGVIDVTPVKASNDPDREDWFDSNSGYRTKVRWLPIAYALGPAICPDGKTVSVTTYIQKNEWGDFGLVLINKVGKIVKVLIPNAEQATWRPVPSS